MFPSSWSGLEGVSPPGLPWNRFPEAPGVGVPVSLSDRRGCTLIHLFF